MMTVLVAFFVGCQKDEATSKSLSGTHWEAMIYGGEIRLKLDFTNKDTFQLMFDYQDGQILYESGKYTCKGSTVTMIPYDSSMDEFYYKGVISGNTMKLSNVEDSDEDSIGTLIKY